MADRKNVKERGVRIFEIALFFFALIALIDTANALVRPITITNNVAQTLTDYQVSFTLDTANLIAQGKMRSDCGDLRVTQSDGQTLLPYWIESGCNTNNTKIWTKVPSIPAGGSTTIYIWYGNPQATSVANGSATMFIYEDYSIPPSGFLAGNATYDSANKWVQLTPATTNQFGYLYYTKVPTNPTGFYAKFYFWAGGGDGADAVWLGAYDTNYTGTIEDAVNGGYHFAYDEYQDRICFTKSTVDGGNGIACASETTIDNSQWHLAEIYFWYNGSAACAKIYYDGVLKVSACDPAPQSNVVSGTGQIIWGGRTGGLYNYHRIGNGLLYMAKYISPEPSVSTGEEQKTFTLNDILPHLAAVLFIFLLLIGALIIHKNIFILISMLVIVIFVARLQITQFVDYMLAVFALIVFAILGFVFYERWRE